MGWGTKSAKKNKTRNKNRKFYKIGGQKMHKKRYKFLHKHLGAKIDFFSFI
jgi:hypothetical protein